MTMTVKSRMSKFLIGPHFCATIPFFSITFSFALSFLCKIDVAQKFLKLKVIYKTHSNFSSHKKVAQKFFQNWCRIFKISKIDDSFAKFFVQICATFDFCATKFVNEF